MVVERFKNVERVGERFKQRGRMLPEGVAYHASWVDPAGNRCFQVMEAPNEEALTTWVNRWRDLVEFEIVQVLMSADFWAARAK